MVFEEIAFVEITVRPVVYTEAVFFVQHVVSFVILTAWLSVGPNSVSVSVALLEISAVETAIDPSVFPKPFRQAIHKLALVFITVKVILCAFSMLQPILEVP